MYTRQELSKIKQGFWTRFGQYMAPIVSATSEKVNWVNYKTGIQGIRFVMNADRQQAHIAIVLSHSDDAIRLKYYNQLKTMNSMLHETLSEEWNWKENDTDEYGKLSSSIGTKINNVDITDQSSWPAIITFFKQRIIALDAFWAETRFVFEML